MAEGKAGTQQGVFHVDDAADAHAPIVELRAGTACGGKHFLADRVVDQRCFQTVLVAQGDGNGKVRDTVQEVGSAVERVDDPLVLIILGAVLAGFLSEDAVVGIGLAQGLDDLAFRLHVSFTDEVVALLGGDIQPFEVIEVAQEDAAGAQCGALGNVQSWVHGRSGQLENGRPGYPVRNTWMYDEPAGLSHCVMTRFASPKALRIGMKQGVQRSLKISPRRLAVRPSSRGRRCAYALWLAP
jgi:hypothetical protein